MPQRSLHHSTLSRALQCGLATCCGCSITGPSAPGCVILSTYTLTHAHTHSHTNIHMHTFHAHTLIYTCNPAHMCTCTHRQLHIICYTYAQLAYYISTFAGVCKCTYVTHTWKWHILKNLITNSCQCTINEPTSVTTYTQCTLWHKQSNMYQRTLQHTWYEESSRVQDTQQASSPCAMECNVVVTKGIHWFSTRGRSTHRENEGISHTD